MRAALVSAADLLHGGPSSAAPDATILQEKAEQAQALVESACGRTMGLDSYAELHSGASAAGADKSRLYLRAWPVDPSCAVAVLEDGSPLSVSPDPATNPDVILVADRGVLIRPGGWSDSGPANVSVSYSAGWTADDAPRGLVFLVCSIAWRLYQLRTTGGTKTSGRAGSTAAWDNTLTPLETAALSAYRATMRPRTTA